MTSLADRELEDAHASVADPTDDDPSGDLDPRLGLMLVCAHPAIDSRIHAPLMMQVVMGIDAARIASAFLTAPATMGQRLSRAKTKIRDGGIRFRHPEPVERAERLAPVLAAVYATYTVTDPLSEFDAADDATVRSESIRLAREVSEAFPGVGEAHGLLALLLHTEGRRPGRFTAGRFTPIEEQDPSRWDATSLALGNAALDRATECLRTTTAPPGRYQLEAAISAAHSARAEGGSIDWAAIRRVYDLLMATAPSVGAVVGAAGAALAAGDASGALTLLDALDPADVSDYAPYWVCRAQAEKRLGHSFESSAARAVGLTSSPALRAHLLDSLRQ